MQPEQEAQIVIMEQIIGFRTSSNFVKCRVKSNSTLKQQKFVLLTLGSQESIELMDKPRMRPTGCQQAIR